MKMVAVGGTICMLGMLLAIVGWCMYGYGRHVNEQAARAKMNASACKLLAVRPDLAHLYPDLECVDGEAKP